MKGKAPSSFGYSGTPLVRKLGIKPHARLQFVSPPHDFEELVARDMPSGTVVSRRGPLDFALLFVKSSSELKKDFPLLRDRLESNGMLWVGWPKKSSGVATDLTEDVVREYGLEAGLVDVKVCAIDDVWSGLKFVRRLKDR
jgi:hypothetical protein